MPVWSPDGDRFAFTAEQTTIVIADPSGERETMDAAEALSGEMTWSPDGQVILLAPWDASSSSTLLDLSRSEPSLSNVELEFDASPPFVSPPQWAPAVALPPKANPALAEPTIGEPVGS